MSARGQNLAGQPAGIATRGAAYLLDVVIAFAAYALALAFGSFAWNLIVDDRIQFDVRTDRTDIWSIGFIVFWVLYLWFFWAIDGSSPGKALSGLRLIHTRGGEVRRLRALCRALLYVVLPPPVISTPFVVLRRDRRGFHDLVCGTRVVYDWGPRPVRPRTPRRVEIASATTESRVDSGR